MAGTEQLSSQEISGTGLIDLNPLQTVLQIGNQVGSRIAQNIASYFPAQGALNTRLAITATAASTATLVITGPGNLIALSVTVASSTGATGTVYDSATTVVTSTQAAVIIPSCVGYYTYPWPYANGLVILPGSTLHTISVSYR